MLRKPRNQNSKFFSLYKMIYSVFQGILLLAMVLVVHYTSINDGHTEGEVRAIAFTSLILGNIFLILTNLSDTRNFLHVFTQKSKSALIIISLSFIVLFSVISFKPLQEIFHFEFPGYKHFVPSIMAALIMLCLLEVRKIRTLFNNRSKS